MTTEQGRRTRAAWWMIMAAVALFAAMGASMSGCGAERAQRTHEATGAALEQTRHIAERAMAVLVDVERGAVSAAQGVALLRPFVGAELAATIDAMIAEGRTALETIALAAQTIDERLRDASAAHAAAGDALAAAESDTERFWIGAQNILGLAAGLLFGVPIAFRRGAYAVASGVSQARLVGDSSAVSFIDPAQVAQMRAGLLEHSPPLLAPLAQSAIRKANREHAVPDAAQTKSA